MVVTLGGCEKEEAIIYEVDQGVTYLLQDPANAQVKEEIERLYNKGRMPADEYSGYIANGIHFESSNFDHQIYLIGGDVGYTREQIQQEMKTR